MSQNNPFAFLENSTTQALLGSTAVASAVGPGFLSAAAALAPSAPQLMGETLRRLSIGNSLADAFGAGQRQSQDSPQRQPVAQPTQDVQTRQPSVAGGDIDAAIRDLRSPQAVSDAIDRLRNSGRLTPELSKKLLDHQAFLNARQ